jgi:hypothetical protein
MTVLRTTKEAAVLYQIVPEQPIGSCGRWPDPLETSDLGECPECRADYTTFRALNNDAFDVRSGSFKDDCIPDFPHISYQCGGGWRKVYDHWEGFCGKPKTVQLELQFTEENL